MHLWKSLLTLPTVMFLGLLPFQALGAGSPSLCTADEVSLFACPLPDQGRVSVCASKDFGPECGYLQYRQGRAGSVELTLPADRIAPARAASSGMWMFSGGGGAYMQFKDGDKARYVYSATGRWGAGGETQSRDGVALRKGDTVTDQRCQAEAQSELGPELFEKAGLPEVTEEFELPE